MHYTSVESRRKGVEKLFVVERKGKTILMYYRKGRHMNLADLIDLVEYYCMECLHEQYFKGINFIC